MYGWLTAGSALPRARGARDHDRRESDPVLGAGAVATYTTNNYHFT